MGPPGAGKGTQAEMLAQEIKYHRFSTGDAFRAISRQDSDLGRRVKETIDNGYLAPPEMAAEVVINAVREYVQEDTGLIFDGTPRTVREAELVDEFFEKEGYGRPLAIRLVVDKEDMIERNSKRKFCLDIDNDFPVVTEEDEKKCNDLGGKIGMRPDDASEIFATRWEEFMNQTYPVIEKYKAEGILQEVDGKPATDEVFEKVMAVINRYSKSSEASKSS